ncbi:MAG: BolA/IbaG family iron-sulfur metabolism protein [Endozoicomonas sp. (ex Botrylloides leachii)]|nr:BolA/IbaG family iron-sulfur metabolism protein [Endozoicomonas sp. (ex Botrylloides leachii)]
MNINAHIHKKLSRVIRLSHIEVINESYLHNVPPGSESHLKVVLVSNDFAGKMPVKRHQLVYNFLAEELQNQIHALALHTYTEKEWKEKKKWLLASPDCQHKQSSD